MKRIYIAGPYSSSPVCGIRDAIYAAQSLRSLGFVPFVPHLSHLWDLVITNPYDFYLDLDLEWLEVCDALLRLPGDSPGADVEVGKAVALGIPVFHSVDEVIAARAVVEAAK